MEVVRSPSPNLANSPSQRCRVRVWKPSEADCSQAVFQLALIVKRCGGPRASRPLSVRQNSMS
ncbi:hypothetical protein D3C85_1922990 [compost metagenome]